jgi:predicted phage tail component-like protein
MKGGNMGKEIEWSRITWNEGDDFIAFAFGDFDSKSIGLVRTSQSSRYEEYLSAPTKDLTAEVPGGDGQYYFGTYHQPKVFNVNFAFDNLTKRQIRELKRVFSGKEMRELTFAEEYNKIYMAKVTSQPNLKTLCFDVNGEEIYKGEGTV